MNTPRKEPYSETSLAHNDTGEVPLYHLGLEEEAEPVITRPRRAWLRINYGINRRDGLRLVHRCGKMRIRGDWDDDATHEKIRAVIRARHPGWLITGCSIVKPAAR